jgi:hypothetical protein
MQLLFVFSAILLGFGYSHFFGGFEFYTFVCLFAGVFLVTPVLFQFQFKDFKLISQYKLIVFKNFIVNLILLPILALCIGWFSGDFGIAGALLLLSLLAGGGMVMHWIKQSEANIKLGFILFFLNISLLFISFFLFDFFSTSSYVLSLYGQTQGAVIPIEPFGVFVVLILIPLILSRIILKFAPSAVLFVENNKDLISSFAIFAIVFYLFALKSSSNLINLDIAIALKAFVATAVFYILSYVLASAVYKNNKNDKNELAGFWHIVTRFITIALVIATYAVEIYGYSFLLPIMIAYFIQIPLSSQISKNKALNTIK